MLAAAVTHAAVLTRFYERRLCALISVIDLATAAAQKRKSTSCGTSAPLRQKRKLASTPNADLQFVPAGTPIAETLSLHLRIVHRPFQDALVGDQKRFWITDVDVADDI
jgi:hypothetical protein